VRVLASEEKTRSLAKNAKSAKEDKKSKKGKAGLRIATF
jgi:hypothetical protein